MVIKKTIKFVYLFVSLSLIVMDLILHENPTEKTMYKRIGMCQHNYNWLPTYCRCSDNMFYKMVLGAHNEGNRRLNRKLAVHTPVAT